MKLLRFAFKKDIRQTQYPLSQKSRINIDRPKHDIGNKEFMKLVNDHFKPMIKEHGYEGKDYFYYRLRNDNLETIVLGTSPYGKAICINAEIKKANGVIPKVSEIEELESISPTPRPWKRLTPDESDCWWWFRPTEEENQAVFKEKIKLITTVGENYFKKFNK